MTDAVRIASELVRIASINPMGRGLEGPGIGEAALSAWLESHLRGLGVPVWRQHVRPGRDNVVARMDAPGAGRTILLDVHQDTVPGDAMKIPPFSGEVSGGRLWGRGACDVKGGMASVLAAAARLAAKRPRGTASVILAFTVDEEHTFRGAQRLMQGPWGSSGADLPGPDMAVVVEPTLLKVVIAHKGLTRWKVRTTGRSSHGASPELGVNAVYLMSPVIQALEEHARELGRAAPHPLLGRPTMNLGLVSGGTSVNTVPASCVVELDRRLIPGEDAAGAWRACRDGVIARLPQGHPVSFEEPWLAEPPLDTPSDARVVSLAMEAVSAVEGRAETRGVPYGTDGSTIAAAGVPTIVLGPGDIAQAHTEDEWIETAQIERAAEVFYRLMVAAG
jgi:acetylornithine deacetylase/succinyl-diaminopimelate desuccinylase-like protein